MLLALMQVKTFSFDPNAILHDVLVNVPAIIAAVAAGLALIQSKRNGIKTDVLVTKAVEVSGKTDTLVKTTDAIHVLANSNYTTLEAQNRVLNERIAGLEKALTALTKVGVDEMQRQAIQAALNTPSPLQIASMQRHPEPAESLKDAVFDAIHSLPAIPVTITDSPVPVKVIDPPISVEVVNPKEEAKK